MSYNPCSWVSPELPLTFDSTWKRLQLKPKWRSFCVATNNVLFIRFVVPFLHSNVSSALTESKSSWSHLPCTFETASPIKREHLSDFSNRIFLVYFPEVKLLARVTGVFQLEHKQEVIENCIKHMFADKVNIVSAGFNESIITMVWFLMSRRLLWQGEICERHAGVWCNSVASER